MKKLIFIITTIAFFGIIYFIFLHRHTDYIAGEKRYFTTYEKYKAKEKSVAFSPKAYENDKYNLKSLKDRTKNEIDKLEEFRIELNSIYNLLNNSSNSVSDYENYVKTLKKLGKSIEDNQQYYKWQQNDLIDLNKFISEIEQDSYSIHLYKSDIHHVSSVINSIDSTALTYINFTKILEITSLSKKLDLLYKIKEENERKRQELIAQRQQEKELEKLRAEKKSDYSLNSYSTYYSNNYVNNTTWSNSHQYYSNSSILTLPSNSINNTPSFQPQYNSTNTNPNHVQVDGYYKENGTYVESHMRTAPNNTIIDNFLVSPNLNPYTGKVGTIKVKPN